MINLKKKIIAASICALGLSALLSFSVSADINGVSVSVDGKKLDTDVAPVITDGRTLVPMRAIFEVLGADIEWDDAEKTVSATKNDTFIKLTVGKNEMTVNGRTVRLDVPATIRNGRTMVPIRAVSEALGVDVEWYSDVKTVAVNSKEPEKTVLYNLDHEETEVEKSLINDYLSIGFKESVDGLYTTLYSELSEAKIPIDTLEDNTENGWSDTKPVLSLNDESYYERTNKVIKVFWHPVNTSGKTVTKYTANIYYVETESGKGYEKRVSTLTNKTLSGQKLGITTTIPENCYFELGNIGECSAIFIGEVTLRFSDGKTQEFWCGQSLTEGKKWDGTMYNRRLEATQNGGEGGVIYNIYSLDGETKKATLDEFEALKPEGWYLTPATKLYCKDGSVIIASSENKDELLKKGLYEREDDILVKVYDNSGNITSVHPSQLFEALNSGYKEYKEPVKVLYYDDGTTYAAGESEIDELLKKGWHLDKKEILTTVYAPDESQMDVLTRNVDDYIAVGWSTYPVTTVYDAAGYGRVVRLEEKEKYVSEGYLASLEALYFPVYHPDGRIESILPYETPNYTSSGWYTEPVTYIYNENGETLVISKDKTEEYISLGWALSEEELYRSYFSLTGSVRGLKSDEDKYIANGWKMAPFPIKINSDMYLLRANIWSVYSYKLFWHPVNVSGRTIESYRIEYHIPEGDGYIENYEDITADVKNGETLGNSEFADHFLVSLPEGCDTVIIGKITVQYDDGEIDSFWCGQAVSLSDKEWNGKVYTEEFISVETQKTEEGYSIVPVGKIR